MQKDIDFLKGFGLSDKEGIDFTNPEVVNSTKKYVNDFINTVPKEQNDLETKQYNDTGLFSNNLQNQFKDYLKNQKINNNENQIFGNNPISTPTVPIPLKPEVPTNTTPVVNDNNNTIVNDSTQRLLDKNTMDSEKQKQDYLKNYALGFASFDKNKGYFTNFDDISGKYKSVLNDVSNAIGVNKGTLTDQQYLEIANRNGVTLEEAKNPMLFANKLEKTEEGKRILGDKDYYNSIDKLNTSFARNKEDLANSFTQNLTSVNQKIDDTKRQIDQNVNWMEASGAWSGASKSSGYTQGIQNIKDEGDRILNRLKEASMNLKSANDTDLKRLTEDYNLTVSKVSEEFTTQKEKINQNALTSLVGLEQTYGLGSLEAKKQLDKIADTLQTDNQTIISNYIKNLSDYQRYLHTEVDNKNKQLEQQELKANTRYTEYTSNNGLLLGNTNLSTLLDEYDNGKISAQKLFDLQNIMKNSIQSQLSKLGKVGSDDLNTINHLLEQGKTPVEIISQMQTLDKFKQQKEFDKTVSLGDKTRIYYKDGSYEEVATPKTTESWQKLNDSILYNQTTGAFKDTGYTPPTKENESWQKLNEDTLYNQATSETKNVGTNTGGTNTGGTNTGGTNTGGTNTGGTDLTQYSSSYPKEASLKNNNPAGMTYNSIFAKTLQNAGIQFSNGTPRPISEGGSYFKFPNIEEGMKAYNLLWNSPSYTNLTVGQALNRWGTGNLPGVNINKKVSDLTQEEKENLQMAQLKKESPGMYKTMLSIGLIGPEGFNLGEPTNNQPAENGNIDDYINKINSLLPAGMKDNKSEQERVEKMANNYIKEGLTPNEGALKFKGYNIIDKEKNNIALQYVDIGDNLGKIKPENYESTISKYINKNDNVGLSNYINGLVDDKTKDRYGKDALLSADYKVGNEMTDKIVNLISKNTDKLGIVAGKVNDIIQKFEDTPDYQEIKTLLEMSQADIRKYFAGSAVTETEMKVLENFIGGNTSMHPNNLITMLKTFSNKRKSLYEKQRNGLTEPVIAPGVSGNTIKSPTGNTYKRIP